MTVDPADFDRLPAPPRNLPARGFALDVVEDLVVFRLHWDANPLRPKRHLRGKYRFDAPRNGAEYPVTYANLAAHGAFAEVYGDTQLISERETDRRFSTLIANRPLRLIALDDPTVQKTLRLDGRIAMSKQYVTTMLWSRALHRWFPDADGIRYASRHAGGQFPNFCLLLDRCRSALAIAPRGRLGDAALRPLVLDAADRYRLTVLIPRSR
ncbi:MAG: RES family NAD+ phosphorylase [Solirubrobacterales bacterium]|nr:RES family NAD+ phosphorylase [Solirubrobacterales bacterium]